MDHLQIPHEERQWKNIASQFYMLWNFPNCIGALDGKHVQIQPPPNSGSLYYNYKQFNSVVLLALVDAEYRFLYVDVGSYGRISDGGVFTSCSLSTALESNALHVPNDCKLPGSSTMTPFVVVADDAFPLKNYIMKPFGSKNLSHSHKIYNYRLSRARRVVENAFGILSSRFRVFGKAIPLSPEKVQDIVMAACCLHNFLLRDSSSSAHYMPDDDPDPSSDLQSVGKQAGNRASSGALLVRDAFCSYFTSDVGAVSWQGQSIN